MTLVNSILEVLQIVSLNESIFFIKCKSEKPFDIVLGKLIVLAIKFHLVSIVKSLDAILNFDLVLPFSYHKLLLSTQYALL